MKSKMPDRPPLIETLAKISDIGGTTRLFEQTKPKFDVLSGKDKRGFSVSKIVCTMHLDALSPDLMTFAAIALEDNSNIFVEKAGENGGKMNHAIFTKEFSEPTQVSGGMRAEAVSMVHASIMRTLNEYHEKAASEGVAAKASAQIPLGKKDAFSGLKSTRSSAAERFFGRILSKNQTASLSMD